MPTALDNGRRSLRRNKQTCRPRCRGRNFHELRPVIADDEEDP
jgi:hypothetical protein